jgi:CelD/BcsL family acetyltransferase involved in cellulose biosynthesis
MERVDQPAAPGVCRDPFAEAAPGISGGSARPVPESGKAEAPVPAGARRELHSSLESLDALRVEWDALLEQYAGATPFCTWEWLATWWRAYAQNDRLLVLAARDASAALIGLAPLALSTERSCGVALRTLRLMGDGSHDSDNLDLPVRPGSEAEFSQALINWIREHSREWDVGRWCTLPAQSPVGGRLLADLQALGWNVRTSTRPHTVLALPETWEGYLKGLSSNERSKIGRRMRRVEKLYDVRVRKCAEPAELGPALDALFDLHGKHWRQRGLPGSFQLPARRRFYRELAPLLLARQRLEFWLLELDGRVVAAQFAMRHGNSIYGLQEGFDPEYSADSVGYVLRSYLLKELISRGMRLYDFLGGPEEAKMRWGARAEHYLDIAFARPRSRGSLVLSLERASGGFKGWLRTKLPEPALRTLKRLRGQRGDGA